MGQFKPMVKMETTEPSVILKLKKGGHVDMKKGSKAENGHAPMKRMDGGVMSALAGTPALVGRPAVNAPVRAPGKPSMAARRAAMMARPKAMPQAMPTPVMKKGGKVWEGSAKDEAQDKKLAKKRGMSMKAWEKSSMDTKHDKQKSMKGLKEGGGVKMSNAGGFKKGGAISYVDGNVTGTPAGKTNTVTGAVKKANAGGFKNGGIAKMMQEKGGVQENDKVTRSSTSKVHEAVKNPGYEEFKKGGAAKKAFATGGLVNTGKPVAMPQGRKKPTPPVAINQLSGTFKKGGRVKKYAEGGEIETETQQDPQMMRPRGVDGRGTTGTDGRMGMRRGMPRQARDNRLGMEPYRSQAMPQPSADALMRQLTDRMNASRSAPVTLPAFSPKQPMQEFTEPPNLSAMPYPLPVSPGNNNPPMPGPSPMPIPGPYPTPMPVIPTDPVMPTDTWNQPPIPGPYPTPMRRGGYAGGGNVESDAYARWKANEKAENEADAAAMNPMNWFKGLQELPTKAMEFVNKARGAPGAVTKTEKSTTVMPQKRRSGGRAC